MKLLAERRSPYRPRINRRILPPALNTSIRSTLSYRNALKLHIFRQSFLKTPLCAKKNSPF